MGQELVVELVKAKLRIAIVKLGQVELLRFDDNDPEAKVVALIEKPIAKHLVEFDAGWGNLPGFDLAADFVSVSQGMNCRFEFGSLRGGQPQAPYQRVPGLRVFRTKKIGEAFVAIDVEVHRV